MKKAGKDAVDATKDTAKETKQDVGEEDRQEVTRVHQTNR